MMRFKKIIQDLSTNNYNIENHIYSISKDNLQAIKVLVKNCLIAGEQVGNVELVSVSPNIWLSDFLDRNINYIKYVTKSPKFDVLTIDNNGEIISKSYLTEVKSFSTDKELDDFLSVNKWKKLVIYHIIRRADLTNMTYTYQLKYADITEKYEVRDNKIDSVLNDDYDDDILSWNDIL